MGECCRVELSLINLLLLLLLLVSREAGIVLHIRARALYTIKKSLFFLLCQGNKMICEVNYVVHTCSSLGEQI